MTESYKHLDLKYDLYASLLQDDKYADVEKTIGSTRTDIVTEIGNLLLAIEIQYTPIPIKNILHRMREHTKKNMHTLWLFPEEFLMVNNNTRNLKCVRFIQQLQEGVIFILRDQQIIPARLDNSLICLASNVIASKKKFLSIQEPISLEDLTFTQNELYGVNIVTVKEWWLDSYLELFNFVN